VLRDREEKPHFRYFVILVGVIKFETDLAQHDHYAWKKLLHKLREIKIKIALN